MVITTLRRFRTGGVRALYPLCRVDRNLGRFDRHPDAGAGNEPELQDRGARDLRHERDRADDPDANSLALQVDRVDLSAPNVSGRAIWPRSIQRHRTRM